MEEEKKILKIRVINGINSGANESGKDKGEFWGAITKNRFASKANEFGNWMVNEEYWETNPFKVLPKEFSVLGSTRAVTFTAEEVEKLFSVAMKKQNRRLIPYMAFIFFSGARPYEIAGDKKERRFDYGDMMEWKQPSSVTGGVLFEVCVFDKSGKRKSKGARDRFADLAPAGVDWMKWYHKEVSGNEQLPTEGKVDYSRRIFARIKKEALDYYWPPDAPRHTFTSLAHRNEEFKTNNANYWLDKCGHSFEVFQKRYNAPKTQDECEKYFNIVPSNFAD
jgi:integrase